MSIRKLRRRIEKEAVRENAHSSDFSPNWDTPEVKYAIGIILQQTNCPLDAWPAAYTLTRIAKGHRVFRYHDEDLADKMIALLVSGEIQSWMRQFKDGNPKWDEEIESVIQRIEADFDLPRWIEEARADRENRAHLLNFLCEQGLEARTSEELMREMEEWAEKNRHLPVEEKVAGALEKMMVIEAAFDAAQGRTGGGH